MDAQQLINTIKDGTSKGCRFISFLYTTKTTHETSLFTLLLGVNIEHAYRRDLKVVPHLKAMSNAEKLARAEIVESLRASLEFGIGNNPAYTQKGLYTHITKGVRLNQDTREFHLTGFIINKQVIKEGEYKKVSSSEKTLAKKRIKKTMRSSRFRDFIITPEHIAGLRINGKVIEFQPTNLDIAQLSRETLRKIARERGVLVGRNKLDTINNLIEINKKN